VAVDYSNPDSSGEVMHLLFTNAQTFMVTPEELDVAPQAGAALTTLGRSPWLRSFNPRHLEQCEHIRASFYDETLDVICERVEAKKGGYVA
jgi:hypothetical protein